MQMRVGRHIGNHTGHFEMLFCRGGTESQYLSQRLRPAEITVRGTRCQHHSVRSNQLPFPLPFQDREIEQLEERRLGIAIPFFGKLFILICNYLLTILRRQPDILLDAGNFTAHGRGMTERGGCPVIGQCFPFIEAAFHPVDTIAVVESIIAQFKTDIEQDQQGGRDTDGQAEYIDHRKRLPRPLAFYDLRQVIHIIGLLSDY